MGATVPPHHLGLKQLMYVYLYRFILGQWNMYVSTVAALVCHLTKEYHVILVKCTEITFKCRKHNSCFNKNSQNFALICLREH